MNAKKILALMLCAMMLLSLAACGAKDYDCLLYTSLFKMEKSKSGSPAQEYLLLRQ